jgi:hypothetical protein
MTLSKLKVVRVRRWSWLANRFLGTLHAFLLVLKNVVPNLLRKLLFHIVLLLEEHLLFVFLTVRAGEFLIAFLGVVDELFVVFFAVLLVRVDELVLVQVFLEVAVFFFFGVVAGSQGLGVGSCAIITILRLTRVTVAVLFVLLAQFRLLSRLRSVEVEYVFCGGHVLQVEDVFAPEDDGCTVFFHILHYLAVSSVA